MRKRRRANWTDELEEFVIENYNKMTSRDISKELNCTMAQLKLKTTKLKEEGKIKGPGLVLNTKLGNTSLVLSQHDIGLCKGDTCLIKTTNKGESGEIAGGEKPGKVIYKDNKMVTIRTKNYNISYTLVDVLIGNIVLEKVV